MMKVNIKGDDIYKEVIDLYEYRSVDNVITYDISSDYYNWDVYTHIHDSDNKIYVLVIDCTYHDAFCHWVYESAIYLPLFNILKNKYPNIKLHLKGYKKYKELFCTHFNIVSADILYQLPSNNCCIFPLPISCLNNKDICNNYKAQVYKFINHFKNNSAVKTIFILLMPRQVKENYKGNDRVYYTGDIETNIQHYDDSYILNTDEVVVLSDQINIVNNSKNIILTAGSPYFVNGIFTNNSTIIVLDDLIISQINEFKKMGFLHNIISTNNTVHIVPRESPFRFNNIKHLLL